jgi:hypothetical protein
MFLKQLTIRRKDKWEDAARPLVGSVWFEGPTGEEIKINLTEEAATQITFLCANGIVEASREISKLLVEDMLQYKALEVKPNDQKTVTHKGS